MRGILLLSIVGLVSAGCIAPREDQLPSSTLGAGVDADMTAKETRADKVDVCKEGITLVGGAGGFCAERRIDVEGTLRDISGLEVSLSTFNGAIEVFDDQADQWGLSAVLRARGTTEDEAKRNLEKIVFSYEHTRDGEHFLSAEASTTERQSSGLSASFYVTLPRTLVLRLAADTTNGGITVKGMRTDGLSAHTTNGGIEVEADVTQVDLDTTNGGIAAILTPTSSGRISLDTTNGGIELALPEDATRGYDLAADTTNGKVAVNLQDGTTTRDQSNPYYDSNNEARFVTNDYAGRRIQSQVMLDTTNGGITVDPK